MKNFAIIGAAGFIAERHIRAIHETGNQIVVAADQFDVMGRMDSYFPNADFFLDFADFENYIQQNPIDYTSICSPNHMHAIHIQTALHAGSDAICEKPLVLNPDELEAVEKAKEQSGNEVYNILQLRLHPAIQQLREQINQGPADKIYDIDLSYMTSRGKWYFQSWKGDLLRSGGVTTNIGIHFFDMLMWIFGPAEHNTVHLLEDNKAAGFLQLKQARVRWFLSLDFDDIPQDAKLRGQRTYRSISLEGKEIEFSEGFTSLHTRSYEHILSGNGFTTTDARACILLTHAIRNSTATGLVGDYHPLLTKF